MLVYSFFFSHLYSVLPSLAAAIKRCQDVFGVTPKDLQLQVAECIGRGQDCILIAGCEWDKPLAYFLPMVLWSDRVFVVISPLEVPMQEQCQRLRDLDISAITITSLQCMKDDTIGDLATGKYRAVFMTPEIIFESQCLNNLWSRDDWQQRLQAVVLDEAHCVSTWDDDFSEAYGRIGQLRLRLPREIAFIALSATLPPRTLEDLKSQASIRKNVITINVGNDRANIWLEVRYLELEEKFKHLDFLLDFKKTMVYFDSGNETVRAAKYLKTLAPIQSHKIAVYHSVLSEDCKQRIMADFVKGTIAQLLVAEATGIGCDISDVIRVVQFRCPNNISTLVRRLGQAARNPLLRGQGILLVPPPSPETKFPDPNLTHYITTKECRRQVLNEVFDNEIQPNGNCCDLCHPPLETSDMLPKARAPPRTPQQKESAGKAIEQWRSEMFLKYYSKVCDFYTEQCVMTDKMIATLPSSTGYLCIHRC
ncbi:P-loop containing nucleoside triphosphate hydrolase protein [Dissophora ornata]|nr:P-loop containing nucleoside triphosphate hydrolase protein [Dissophora ornata]